MGVTIRSTSGDRRAPEPGQREPERDEHVGQAAAATSRAERQNEAHDDEREVSANTPLSPLVMPRRPERPAAEPQNEPINDPEAAPLIHAPRAAMASRPSHAPLQANVTFTNRGTSRVASEASSIECRKRAAEREARRKILEIRRLELRLEKQLVEEELAGTLEQIELESVATRSSKDRDRVEEWITRNQDQHFTEERGAVPRRPLSPEPRAVSRGASPPATTRRCETSRAPAPSQYAAGERSGCPPPPPPPPLARGQCERVSSENNLRLKTSCAHNRECADYCRCGRERSFSAAPTATLEHAVSQLVALNSKPSHRQVWDLPHFSGLASEWTTFYSAYQESTNRYKFTAWENLTRLRHCLKGEAKDCVQHMLASSSDPELIIRILKKNFGRSDLLVDKALNELKRLPYLGPSATDLNDFAIKIVNIVSTLSSIDRRTYADNPFIIREITERLSPHVRLRWCQHAEEKLKDADSELALMVDFLLDMSDKELQYSHARGPADRRTAPLPHSDGARGPRRAPVTNFRPPGSGMNQRYASNNRVQTFTTDKVDPCLCCGGTHMTTTCKRVLSMSVPARWDWAKNNKVCFKCLDRTHRRGSCKMGVCGEEGCQHPHHRLLHDLGLQQEDNPTPREPPPSRRPQTGKPTEPATTRREHAMTTAVQERAGPERDTTLTTAVLLKVIPILLSGPNGEIKCHALADDGSTISLFEKSLADAIGATGIEAPLHISGLGAMTMNEPSRQVTVQIRGLTGGPEHTIKLRTVSNLGIRSQQIPKAMIDQYEHLRGLEEATYDTATPRVLIGADNWHLILPLEARVGLRNQPAAVRTDLGWLIYGHAPQIPQREERVLHLRDISQRDCEVNKQLQRYFEIDSLGVKLIDKVRPLDQRAVKLFNDTIKQVSGQRYEVGQLWRDDEPKLPPSYNTALTRLRGIERKMDKSPTFSAEYTAQIENLLQKGYAERVVEPGPDPRAYYLPHFGAVNPNKPKTRLVFDAAALNQGRSLNHFLLEGPDMLQSLLGIILRFREGPYAVTADIQEMFLRIQIREEDRNSQMFLWRAERRTGAPDVYRMKSMIFGAASSPFLAHSVRNFNAYAHETRYPRAVEDITRNHYMDDYVSSYSTEEDAVLAAKEVTACHKQAGFHLRGWSSNSRRLIEQIPQDLRASEPTSIGQKEQKVLGLTWDARTDSLGFSTTMIRVPVEVKEFKREPTKREALSAVMSLYDPCGLISYFSITVKIQLQRLWSLRLEWDSPLPPNECREFQAWLRALEHVSRLRIPRHYGPTDLVRRTLHIFVDASSQAYACVAYWRIEKQGDVHVSLIAAKAKVAPTRPLSIPRMELQSALIGARLKQSILDQHRYEVTETVLWSDSRTVLHWVRDNARRYSAYVSHRLNEIAELTEPEQWRWVPTRHNPADDATRADSTREFEINHRWFKGPDFLLLPQTEWPHEPSNQPEPELELMEAQQCLASRETVTPLPDLSRFSNYDRLLGATARVLQFIEMLKTKTKTNLKVEHILSAERLLLQRAQREDFADELRSLSRGEPLSKRSAIYELDPVLDTDNVLRLRGRIDATPAPINKRPAILLGRNRLAKLIIFRLHRRAAHANNERVVNDIRQEYWILRLRPTVRSIASACQLCRIRKAKPRVPPMGDLPLARIEPHCRAFTNTGLDLFGHVTVTIGRRHEKRWVALYTCMTTRAVHLELVHTLSTDSAIMSLRRMAARRGWPRTIWSDNGSNFRGATAELRAAYEEWLPALRQYGLQYRLDWRFIPPGAPNQGGAWERMVRSVKTALMTTLHSRAPKEEVLVTLLAEAEACVNARPLTHVSVDPSDPETLTPNHFLLGNAARAPITGPCVEADRRAWRTSQALADLFWHRWVREVLPTLAPRRSAATGERPLAVGDLVIIVDPSLPRNVWPRGVVERVFTGPDGGVRSAEVRTKGGTFRRPTTRLAVLPVEPESTQRVDGGSVDDSHPAA